MSLASHLATMGCELVLLVNLLGVVRPSQLAPVGNEAVFCIFQILGQRYEIQPIADAIADLGRVMVGEDR